MGNFAENLNLGKRVLHPADFILYKWLKFVFFVSKWKALLRDFDAVKKWLERSPDDGGMCKKIIHPV